MRTLLLGDIGNRLDIADTERSIDALHRTQLRAGKDKAEKDRLIAALLDELGRHKLAIEALTRFLVEKELIAEEELADFIKDVDAEDGVLDGQMEIDTTRRRLKFAQREIPEGTYRRMPIPDADE